LEEAQELRLDPALRGQAAERDENREESPRWSRVANELHKALGAANPEQREATVRAVQGLIEKLGERK
jgi:hypothetical protein